MIRWGRCSISLMRRAGACGVDFLRAPRGARELNAGLPLAFMWTVKTHPAQMERVTPDSVRAVLVAAGVGHGRVFTFRPGVVRIEVAALVRGRRRARRRAVVAALEHRRHTDCWGIRPVDISYRWRPWITWVTVRDPGLDWIDPDSGLDYVRAQPKAAG